MKTIAYLRISTGDQELRVLDLKRDSYTDDGWVLDMDSSKGELKAFTKAKKEKNMKAISRWIYNLSRFRSEATMSNKAMIKSLNMHVKWITKAIKELDKQLVEHTKLNESVKFLYELYTSVPGVGLITALRLIADLPELLKYREKQLSAMVGLAPMNRDSGKMRGKRSIVAGRAKVRRILYMATISAIKCNPLLKSFYQRFKLDFGHLGSRSKLIYQWVKLTFINLNER